MEAKFSTLILRGDCDDRTFETEESSMKSNLFARYIVLSGGQLESLAACATSTLIPITIALTVLLDKGAVVGSNFGRHDWPGSRRTLEGSVAVFLSSLAGLVVATCCLLGERTEGRAGWAQATARLAWPVALTSLMEAFTSQVGGGHVHLCPFAWCGGDRVFLRNLCCLCFLMCWAIYISVLGVLTHIAVVICYPSCVMLVDDDPHSLRST